MSPVVAFHIELSGPFFDQAINRLNRQELSGLAAGKKIVPIIGFNLIKIISDGFMQGLIHHENVVFTGFVFLDSNGLAGLQVMYILDF